MAKRGRSLASYRSSKGEIFQGLKKDPKSNRWRISQTEERFTEPDERLAIQRFLRVVNALTPAATVKIEGDFTPSTPAQVPTTFTINGRAVDFEDAKLLDIMKAISKDAYGDNNISPLQKRFRDKLKNTEINASNDIAAHAFWEWLKNLLIDQPDYIAKMTGVAEIAGLKNFAIPKKALRLDAILQTYKSHANGKPESKRLAENTFNEFIDITTACTLTDLTVENLKLYRETIKSRLRSPGSVAAYFGRIKNIIRFGKSEGLDPVQIDKTVSMLAILKAPQDNRTLKPSPISPDDFKAIMDVCNNSYAEWTPRLLVMLNCCLHFGEAMEVQWGDFDLGKRTFCSKRNKRGKVIRAATLWAETIAALNTVKRTNSPYVFVSQWGSSFNPKGQWKTWEKIRIQAKLPHLKMDDFRDGAYTAACNAIGVDEKLARLLAGHRSHGLQDNYVERNPAIVEPACDAVYMNYFGGALPA